jgi:hypothetical protein
MSDSGKPRTSGRGAVTGAARKIEPPPPRAPRLTIAAYERLTARARAHVDWLEEQDERARQAWLASVKAQQKAP